MPVHKVEFRFDRSKLQKDFSARGNECGIDQVLLPRSINIPLTRALKIRHNRISQTFRFSHVGLLWCVSESAMALPANAVPSSAEVRFSTSQDFRNGDTAPNDCRRGQPSRIASRSRLRRPSLSRDDKETTLH